MPLVTASGAEVYGSGLPSDIWKSTMDGALKGTVERDLPEADRDRRLRGCARSRRPPPPPPSETVIQPTHRSSAGHHHSVRSAHDDHGRRRRRPRRAIPPGGPPPGGPPPGGAPFPNRHRDRRSAAARRHLAATAGRRPAQRRQPRLPSRTDFLGAALADVIGGPVGRHALIGRARLMTPLRVMFLIALVFLALGWSTKAACLQSTGTGTGDQRVANWDNQRAYYELCYSDTVPLYGAELLSQGKFPYKSSWIETDASGAPQTRYDGKPAVRYMEYPVLTGAYQYASMAVAKTYTALSKLAPLPVVAEVVIFFDVAAFGLALAWLATVWATAGLSGRRIWDAALVAASPLVIFQIFTNFDALATAFAMGGLLAWARRKPVLAGVLIGLGAAAKLYPLLFLGPMLVLGIRTGRLGAWRDTAAWPRRPGCW